MKKCLIAAAALVLMATVATYAAPVAVESRATSWAANSSSFATGQTTTPGKLVGDATYTADMWSYHTLTYALPSSGNPDPSTFTATAMGFDPSHAYGPVFARDYANNWSLPLASSGGVTHYWGQMDSNRYGAAIALNNVFGEAATVSLSGSYVVNQNQWASDGRAVDSYIYKLANDGTTTVLFEDHQVLTNPYQVTITLPSTLSTTLQPGEKIFVALGGRQDGSSGDHYNLHDGALSWSVAVPEPATIALLTMSGVGLLRRRMA